MHKSTPYQYLGDGITVIDTGLERPRFAACYLIESNGHAAIFDSGTNYSVPVILDTLAARGLTRENVRYVIPSHVHLDHAGGVGALLRELPNARVLAHARGMRHLIDPSVLQASAEGVYGADVVAQVYGSLVPVPATRIRALTDGEYVDLNGRALYFIDSPGHAYHHVALYDEASASWFTGDCFGVSYRDFDGGKAPLICPATTPTQFDPVAAKATIARMLERAPRAMLLTHYSRIEQPAEHAQTLVRLLDTLVALTRQHAGRPNALANLTEAIQRMLAEELDRLACPISRDLARSLLRLDAQINAMGLLVWVESAAHSYPIKQ
ncbi:MAG: MBL fold metallo-hydrolase [Rhodanobacter sp.]|jgi:glyoxylase-like metal-dependent hydrolase (beta-lactamase superfamily II)|nr:MBL fold metallo-hydrolase [Rhodanobacter sp.]